MSPRPLLLLAPLAALTALILTPAAAELPLPEPPPAEAPVCFSNAPFPGVYGWADDQLADYMAVVAELTPWEPPPRRIAVLDGCAGFTDTDARASVPGPNWVELSWAGVRRCFDGWKLTYGTLGDRGLAFTFVAAGGCRRPVEAGPIELSRLHSLRWQPEQVADAHPEVRRAAAELLLREQADPLLCELLRATIRGYMRGEVEGGEPTLAHMLRGARHECVLPALADAARDPRWGRDAALAMARILPANLRGDALLSLVEGGGEGSIEAAATLAAYVAPSPRLSQQLDAAAEGSPQRAAAVDAALLALGSR